MKRYEELKDIFYQKIEEKCHGIYKQRAYFHSIQVSTLCMVYAKEKNLNIELSGILGLFHDYSQYINHTSFAHATLSSEMTEKILQDHQFHDNEINIIKIAIAHHSDKDRIHDEYSEILKDADLVAKYYEEPDTLFKNYEKDRIKKHISSY